MSSPIKVVLTGDENVGKSSMSLRLNYNKFSDTYVPTIGVEFCFIDINNNHLQIWDIAGQERFRTNNNIYYRGAAVVLYVYDMTNKASFDYLETHIADVQKLFPVNTVQFLVGTKSDKTNHVVTQSDVDALVAKFNLKADYQVSSKSGETVKTMFNDMFEEGVKPEMTLVDTLLVELSEISKKVASIGERLKTLKH